MASISFSNGRATIQFVDVDNKRKSIRLGAVPKRTADAIKLRVEALLNAKITNTPMDRDTASWLAGIGADLADKLASAGLIAVRSSRLLGEFVEDFIASRVDVKASTCESMRHTSARLVSYFGANRSLNSITAADMDRWTIHLQGLYSPATVGRTIKRARQLFTQAMRAKVIHENPVDGIQAPAQHNPERMRFIGRDTIGKVMEVADREWRLILALARYGGIRIPSELEPLRLADIDFERGRLRVTSPKTARHAGKGERWIPLFPELRPHVEEAFDTAPEGEVYLVRHPCLRQRKAKVNLRKGLTLLLRKACVSPWPRLFHNLRASRQTELAAEFPSHVVCAWLGNSERVAAAHYLQVTDADFDKAISERAKGSIKSAAKPGAIEVRALQNPVQTAPDGEGQKLTQPLDNESFRPLPSPQVIPWQRVKAVPAGLEPAPVRLTAGCTTIVLRDSNITANHCKASSGT